MVVEVPCDGEGLKKKNKKRFDGGISGCRSILVWSSGNHYDYQVGIPCSHQRASAPCHCHLNYCSLPVSFRSVLGTLHL
ncbi:hypothetical protein HKD37_03G008411 [Glycine soja]|nr:hypothetical protein GmHk_03G008458 [Glycine max]